jgi:hypothetical protein
LQNFPCFCQSNHPCCSTKHCKHDFVLVAHFMNVKNKNAVYTSFYNMQYIWYTNLN